MWQKVNVNDFRLPRLCYDLTAIAIPNISAKSTYKSMEISLLISTAYPIFLSFWWRTVCIPLLKSKPITDSNKSFRNGVIDILAQTDTDQPVARHVGMVPISVESHAFVSRISGRCTEVWRFSITTPTVTLLVAIGVTRNEESRVKRMITDQQLVGVSFVCSHAVP